MSVNAPPRGPFRGLSYPVGSADRIAAGCCFATSLVGLGAGKYGCTVFL